MTKDELTAEIQKLDPDFDPGTMTKAELEAVLAEQSMPGPKIERLKFNRGSTRRVRKAETIVLDAAKAFRKEIDLFFYEVDEDGKRVAPAPLVELVVAFEAAVKGGVNELLEIERPARETDE